MCENVKQKFKQCLGDFYANQFSMRQFFQSEKINLKNVQVHFLHFLTTYVLNSNPFTAFFLQLWYTAGQVAFFGCDFETM